MKLCKKLPSNIKLHISFMRLLYDKENRKLSNIIDKQLFITMFFIVQLILHGCNKDLITNRYNFSSGIKIARKFGVYEITFVAGKAGLNPFDVNCEVTFYAPSKEFYTVNAFYDGDNTWKARLYVTETGVWKWKSNCNTVEEIDKQEGWFIAKDSNLKGMIRKYPGNPKRWITDNGQWFLNISDTGYLLFNEHENTWKEYIKDLSKLGVTSIRACSLGGTMWGKKSVSIKKFKEAYPEPPLFNIDNSPWVEDDYKTIDIKKFQTTDKRLIWILNNYPDLYIQHILFGLHSWGEDGTGKLWKSIPQQDRERIMKYMIYRWAAFPNLFFLIVNDIHCSEKYPDNQAFIREVGRYFSANAPWNHLISSGPNRYQEFPFISKEDLEWVSYIHIEDNAALDAEEIGLYEQYPLHVFLGEDWYENSKRAHEGYYIHNPDYYYRWLFWSWTLSGGSANYGGRWARLQPYFMTDSLEYIEPFDSGLKFNRQMTGLNSAKFINDFFSKKNIELTEFVPDHSLATDLCNHAGSGNVKLMRKGYSDILIYHPNALVNGIDAALDENNNPHFQINLTSTGEKVYCEKWYCPSKGEWENRGIIKGGSVLEFWAPWKGKDAVLFLKQVNE